MASSLLLSQSLVASNIGSSNVAHQHGIEHRVVGHQHIGGIGDHLPAGEQFALSGICELRQVDPACLPEFVELSHGAPQFTGHFLDTLPVVKPVGPPGPEGRSGVAPKPQPFPAAGLSRMALRRRVI